MNLPEMQTEMLRLSHLIDAGIEMLRDQARAVADAEMAYRKAKAQAWVSCPMDPPEVRAGEREWTAARREAHVDAQTADLRRDRDIAEALREAAREAVRARRTQLSALQSLLAAERSEMELAR